MDTLLVIIGLVVGYALGLAQRLVMQRIEHHKKIQRCNHCGRVQRGCHECAHGFLCDNCKSCGKN